MSGGKGGDVEGNGYFCNRINRLCYGYLEQEEAFCRHGEDTEQRHETGVDCASLPLFARLPYRKNVKGLPGTPDIVLCKYGIVIFIHGCFWHGHEVDGHIPHSNSEFWRKKIERNRQRDERNKGELKKLGWRVMTVWECQLKPVVRQQTLLEIEYHINHTYLERFKSEKVKPYEIEEKEATGMVAEERVEYRK